MQDVKSLSDSSVSQQTDDKIEDEKPDLTPGLRSRLVRIGRLMGHTETVWSAVWSPNGKLLATCGSDKQICYFVFGVCFCFVL